jgi:hypothetical protein
VLGSLLVALSVGLAIPATALVVADHGARDRQGFLMSSSQDFSTTAYAIASTNLEMHVDAPPAFTPESLLGRTRLTARAADGGEVFLGLAPTSRAREYLDSMRHAVLTGMPGGNPTLDVRGTGAPATSPAEAGIWTVQSSGPGTRTLTWTPRAGDWTVVVMNADASPGVTVAARAGAEVPALGHVVTVLAVVAALVLLLGLALIAWPLRAVARHGTRR